MWSIARLAQFVPTDPDIILEWGPSKDQSTRQDWKDPDVIFAPDATPFIFTTDHRLFIGNTDTTGSYKTYGDTHGEIIARTPELLQRYRRYLTDQFYDDFRADPNIGLPLDENIEPRLTNIAPIRTGGNYSNSNDESNWRDHACTLDLFGRISGNREIVSFWNEDPKLYDTLLKPCIAQLLAQRLLAADSDISTPVHGTFYISELDTVQGTELSPEALADKRLRERLHLMPPAEKKAAMIKLGLMDPTQGAIKSPWQRASEETELVQPGQKWWAPTSEDLLTQIEDLLLEWGPAKTKPWVNPDKSYMKIGARPIIFTSTNRLYFGSNNGSDRHGDLIYRTPSLEQRYRQFLPEDFYRSYSEPEPMPNYGAGYQSTIPPSHQIPGGRSLPESVAATDSMAQPVTGPYRSQSSESEDDIGPNSNWRARVEATDLMGRINNGQTLVSFWNKDPAVYETLLEPCMKQLIQKQLINAKCEISTPTHGTFNITELGTAKSAALSGDELERKRLYEKLHLMKPAEKKAAMVKLGLLDPSKGVVKKPWQRAAEQAGTVQPGQKWWAPTSEAIIADIAAILTDDPDLLMD